MYLIPPNNVRATPWYYSLMLLWANKCALGYHLVSIKIQSLITKRGYVDYFLWNDWNVHAFPTCKNKYKECEQFFREILQESSSENSSGLVYCNFVYTELLMGNFISLIVKFLLYSEVKKNPINKFWSSFCRMYL